MIGLARLTLLSTVARRVAGCILAEAAESERIVPEALHHNALERRAAEADVELALRALALAPEAVAAANPTMRRALAQELRAVRSELRRLHAERRRVARRLRRLSANCDAAHALPAGPTKIRSGT